MDNTEPSVPVKTDSTLTITKVISAARWRRAEDAFYRQVEVTRQGSIQNLRGGILAALKELLM